MLALALLVLFALLVPAAVSAHEVYVLPPETIAAAIAAPPFSEWNVLLDNTGLFFFWAMIAAAAILAVFLASISRPLEDRLDPLLAKLPRFAPLIGRVTIGVSFLAAAYYGALFGPELPLAATSGAFAGGVRLILVAAGLMLIVGYYARLASLAALALFAIEAAAHGSYMLTYANYFGEIVAIGILGSHVLGAHDKHDDRHPAIARLKEALAPYAFPLVRISFGLSLIYASLYAKVIHNQLAFAVTEAYPGLVAFFGFEPHFLVLGAAIIEILIGLFFILGVEIRFTALFLLFWLSLSLWYFGETVWPHLILIGIPAAFICYGYDKYSLEGRLFKKDGREPVL